jgi:hypothetical protein
MPVASEADKRQVLMPDHHLLRELDAFRAKSTSTSSTSRGLTMGALSRAWNTAARSACIARPRRPLLSRAVTLT